MIRRFVIVVVCLFIFFLGFFCPVVWWGFHILNSVIIGCDGADVFYTGAGFGVNGRLV